MQRKITRSFPQGRIITDAPLQEYIEGLGASLRGGDRTYVTASSDKAINAFAIWSDSIVIYSGIIALCETEAELAGIIAHEQAHVSSRHLMRLADQTGLLNQLTALGLMIALFTQSEDALEIFAGARSLQRSAQYSVQRDLEREADQQAVETMGESGLDLEGYLRALRRIHDSSGGGSPPEYMSTHPISTNRMAEVRSYIRNFESRSSSRRGLHQADELSFLLARERAKHIANITGAREVAGPHAAAAAAYGRLLRRAIEPQEALDALLPHAGNWLVAYELAEMLMNHGDLEGAVRVIEEARTAAPDNPALLARLLSILGRSGNDAAARRILRLMAPKLRLHPAIAAAEVRLWHELGDELRYRVAIAHAKYVNGDIDGLKREIEQLQQSASDQPPSAALGRLELLAGKLANLESLLAEE